jgi:hypothetical protein
MDSILACCCACRADCRAVRFADLLNADSEDQHDVRVLDGARQGVNRHGNPSARAGLVLDISAISGSENPSFFSAVR